MATTLVACPSASVFKSHHEGRIFPGSLRVSHAGFSVTWGQSSKISGRRGTITPVVRASAAGSSNFDGNVKEIFSSEDFNRYLSEAGNKLVVLDISTKTCGPCKLIYPKVVKLSEEYPDAVFLKINGDHSADTRVLMREWGIRAVPNFRFFRGGELIHSHSGAKEDELRKHFNKHYAEVPVSQ